MFSDYYTSFIGASRIMQWLKILNKELERLTVTHLYLKTHEWFQAFKNSQEIFDFSTSSVDNNIKNVKDMIFESHHGCVTMEKSL